MNNKRRKRDHLILFEHLPDKLFVEIFDYLNGVDAFFAFSNLNYRFQCLLIKYCRIFDFKSIKKIKLNFVFKHCDTNRWKSLRISDDDDTLGQIEYFSQFYSRTKSFSQLKSLSILGMEIHNISKLLFHFPFLTNLVSLTMKPICGERISKFDLPQLKKLVVSSCGNTNWLKNFSRLKNLEYTFIDCCSNRTYLRWPSTLKRLRIVFDNREYLESIQRSFGNLFRLNTLEIFQKERERSLPDGQIWERIICSSLPSLKNFRFYFQFYYKSISPNKIEQVVASFSTLFYTHEKKWFIRCDLYTNCRIGCFYLLPFSLKQLKIFDKNISISPNNNNLNENIYANMKKFIFRETFIKPDEIFYRTDAISFVIDSYFYSTNWMHILTKLCHLEIKYCTTMSSKNFSFLLDNIPHLNSLTGEKGVLQTLTENWKNIIICNQLSHKIRSLKLYSISNVSWNLNRYELNEILSSIAPKCEHLSLYAVLSIETIAFILRIFCELQSLHVLIIEEDRSKIDMKWLEQQTTKFNHHSSFINHDKYHCYFRLGK